MPNGTHPNPYSIPATLIEIDFHQSPNESNAEYATRIVSDFADGLHKSRFKDQNMGPSVVVTADEALHLVYSVVCAVTGKY